MSDELRGLDRWITGDYKHLQAPLDPPEIEEDEGAEVLISAMKYLKPRADADEEEQLIGDYEAWAILDCALKMIWDDYQCHFCGEPLKRRRDKYCSKACHTADREGY